MKEKYNRLSHQYRVTHRSVLFLLMLSFSIHLAIAQKRNIERAPFKSTYPESRFVNPFSDPLCAPTETEGDGITPGGNGGRPDPKEALDAPVGDAVWLCPLFGLVYGVFLFRRRYSSINRKLYPCSNNHSID